MAKINNNSHALSQKDKTQKEYYNSNISKGVFVSTNTPLPKIYHCLIDFL